MVTAQKSFRFNFWKDTYWAVIFSMPIVFFLLSLVVVEFAKVVSIEEPSIQTDPLLLTVLLLFGTPIWITYWFFLYYFFKFLYTRVTFRDTEITYRAPIKVFPFIPISHHLPMEAIERIDLSARTGIMPAVFLYYQANGKQKRFYLPKINNPAYIQELNQINARLFAQTASQLLTEPARSNQMPSVPQAAMEVAPRHPSGLNKVFRALAQILIVALVIGVGITLAKFPPDGVNAWEIGILGVIFASHFGLIVSYASEFLPVIGQIALWYFGKKIILFAFSLFHLNAEANLMEIFPEISWIIHKWFPTFPASISLLDFIFYDIFALSILISIDTVRYGWIGKKLTQRRET